MPKNKSSNALRAETHAGVIARAIKNPKGVQDNARKAVEYFMSREGKQHLDALADAGVSRTKWSVIKLRYKRIQKRR